MKAKVDKILVQLFDRFDEDIRPRFKNLTRMAKLRIALGEFQDRGWAERIIDDDGVFHWQSTAKLTADRKEAKEMRQPFMLPQRERMTEMETPEEYERCFELMVDRHADFLLVLMGRGRGYDVVDLGGE